MKIVGCGVKNWGGLRPLPGARKSSPGNIFFPFHHVVFTHSHRQITNPGHETRHESSSRAGAKKMPIPEAGEVSSAECIGDLDQRSSTFTAVGTIFGLNGRIGSVGYPPGADFPWISELVDAGGRSGSDLQVRFSRKFPAEIHRSSLPFGRGAAPPAPPAN